MNCPVIIGGAAEAHALAQRLPQAIVRLPEAERVQRVWPGAVSHGPVCPDWLRAQGATAVIEAAHPCDLRVARAALRAAGQAGLPYLQLVRPEWRANRRDRWVALQSAAQARHVVPDGARVLVTMGRAALKELHGLRAHLLIRRIASGGPQTLPPVRCGQYCTGQGPFSVAQEIAFLRKKRIDWLLLRNAGGTGGWPKLAAARQLGLPVAMVERPRRPVGPRVETVEEALEWLSRQ
ncbi:precorrin-6A/cobalt-precorrin-6A reductase [Thalassococcus lentus]|uniref:Precorrin-6A/cobalt-precorrin-6A reductase n=1 Tax=Thalassococcus lentus TaxID=1210524 RepID=A0ABT4XVM6_9RHOB|nr:precorrin-6A/cobalt-precorrin-6A reductase [Thalassococcus lentus]MDA7425952.1 precorrin-6A/cobalt-precorrin-6A reductase [Thalassococcus lentus]